MEVSDSGAICTAGTYSQLSYRREQNKWFHQAERKWPREGDRRGGDGQTRQKQKHQSEMTEGHGDERQAHTDGVK